MYKVAITGCIASGKSMLLYHLASLGFATFDCDAYIKELYKNPCILQNIKIVLPQVFVNDTIHKDLLIPIIQNDLSVLKKLQNILYPYLYRKIQTNLRLCAIKGAKLAFIEIPLVFENKSLHKYDAVIIVKSPVYKRRYNFFKRGGHCDLWHIATRTQWPETKKIGYQNKIKKIEFSLNSKKMLNKETNRLLAKIKCIAT